MRVFTVLQEVHVYMKILAVIIIARQEAIIVFITPLD